MLYEYQKGDKFKVTGVLTNGRNFKPIYTDNFYHAFGINLYKGTIWLIRDGKVSILKKVSW